MKCTKKKYKKAETKSVGPLKNYCTHNKSKKHPQANDRLTDIIFKYLIPVFNSIFLNQLLEYKHTSACSAVKCLDFIHQDLS